MPLWGTSDAASNSPLFATAQVLVTANSDNQTALFGNTTSDAFIAGATVGLFGADSNEVQAKRNQSVAYPGTPGWNLKTTVGSRVRYETLVAMSHAAFPSSDASDDAVLPDYSVVITTQPSSASGNSSVPDQVTFTVAATTVPTGGTLSYLWTYANGESIASGANVGSAQQATLTIDTSAESNGVSYKATVDVSGGQSVQSSNATLTITS